MLVAVRTSALVDAYLTAWKRRFESTSVAVCRRDLKIISRLSLPQTANSKMTVR